MVHFLEAVPDITSLLLQIDALVTPSRQEACPLLPMESLVLGVPVIGTDCLGLREVLSGTPATSVPKENPEALADAIAAFVENPHPAKEAAKTYVVEAAKRFDVNIATKKLLEIYQSFAPV
jgi:glycosyltransferase involved in cell wall biosynthesis